MVSLNTAKANLLTHWRTYALGALLLALWLAAYSSLVPFSQWLTYTLFALERGSALGGAVEFFLYDTPKILLLLVLMVYALAWLRAALHIDRVRDYLAGKGRGVGYFLGAGFGAITPFCSCSSIPLFLGFTMARIPLGITMAFLITSPLINEIAIVLLWGLLGWKFTLLYVSAGLAAGMAGGFIMDALKAERWLQDFVLNQHKASATAGMPLSIKNRPRISLQQRHDFALAEMKSIVKRVWLWVIFGVALGAAVHGMIPQEWVSQNLGSGQWWSVPAAVAVGIPLYTNVTGIIPILESLLTKGLPLGTSLAFCMSTVAASLPEALMLKQIMRWQLLVLFLGILLVIFTLLGWLFNMIPLELL